MVKKDYSKKKYQHPLKQKPKKQPKNRWWRGIVTFIVTLFILLIFGYLLFFSSTFKTDTLQIRGTGKSTVNTIVTKWLTEQSDQKLWGIVPKDNLIILNTNDLKNRLQEDIYVEEVTINKKTPKTIIVEVKQRNPILLYSVNNQFFLIDEGGNTIEKLKADPDISSTGLPYVVGTSSSEFISESEPSLDSSLVSFIENLSNEFPKFLENVAIIRIELLKGKSEIKAITDKGWYILYNTQEDLLIQLSNLYRAINEQIPADELQRLQYVDVRLENYIYYK